MTTLIEPRVKRWRWLVLVVLVLSMMLASPRPGLACDCIGNLHPTPVAFTGRVIAVVDAPKLVRRLSRPGWLYGSKIALLEVEKLRRGPRKPFFLVAGGYGADCYLSFKPGAKYDIYGEQARYGLIDTTICDGSRPVK